MQTTKFLVQGSSLEPYEVTFYFEGQNITVSCTCQAGEFGQICKHRINILNDDSSKIVSGNKTEINEVRQKIKGTPLESKLTQLNYEEMQFEMFKKKLATTKKEIAKIMVGK